MMRIAQIVLDGASAYERKMQRVDAAAIGDHHEVETWHSGTDRKSLRSLRAKIGSARPDVVHVYGPGELPPRLAAGWDVPWVASGLPRRSRIPLLRAISPTYHATAIGDDGLPEAVETATLFGARLGESRMTGRRVIGSVGRGPALAELVEGVFNRLARFRDDVDWNVYDVFPSNEEVDAVEVWVDPAIDENDADGFVAEALVRGRLVVAARTALNSWRLGNGEYGILVKPADANELTHAIAAALFKPEVGEELRHEPGVHAARFSATARRDRLLAVYEDLTR